MKASGPLTDKPYTFIVRSWDSTAISGALMTGKNYSKINFIKC